MLHRNSGWILLLALVFAATAWAREDRLNSTGIAPAAEGKAITSTDRNGNTEIEIQVKHLAAADRLTPPKQMYLVWIQAPGKDPEMLGVLRVNENLEGTLKSSTPYKTFDILVTGEDNPQPQMPSETLVLKGTIERK